MKLHLGFAAAAALFLALCNPLGAHADDSKSVQANSEAPQVTVETLLTNLDHPCGIAIQPETDDVFVANTGAGEVLRLSAKKPSEAVPVITGFPHDAPANADNPTTYVGPLGLAFLNQNMLLVGSGELKNGQQAIRAFELPKTDADAKPIDLEHAKQTLGTSTTTDKNAVGAGNFYAIAVTWFTPNAVYSTNRGNNERGYIGKAEIHNKTTFDKFNNTASLVKIEGHTAAPAAIAIQPRGLIVVGHIGSDDAAGSAYLSFYNPQNVALLGNFTTPLHDIVGLAYSPETGALYAADFSMKHPAESGIYRLDSATIDGRVGVKATKIAAIDRPTALAFGADKALYVTAFGKAADAKTADAKTGQLIEITGAL